MSKYDKIETAADLITEVTMHGLSTATEDICRAQDIFGRSTVEELVALANDNGRNNDKGEPDPDGSWGSGRRGTQRTFYMIAFSIWNWEDATRFYNQHSNPLYIQGQNAIKKVSELNELLKSTNDRCHEIEKLHDERNEKANECAREIGALTVTLEKKEDEIARLKAKLYDLMCENK